MNRLIKINYNNAAVKAPPTIYPYFLSYHDVPGDLLLRFFDALEECDYYYTGYFFDVYIENGDDEPRHLATLDENSEKDFYLDDDTIHSIENFIIHITGYYYNNNDVRQEVDIRTTMYNVYVCSEHTYCSERTICNDAIPVEV